MKVHEIVDVYAFIRYAVCVCVCSSRSVLQNVKTGEKVIVSKNASFSAEPFHLSQTEGSEPHG